jgi:hypothetical protein
MQRFVLTLIDSCPPTEIRDMFAKRRLLYVSNRLKRTQSEVMSTLGLGVGGQAIKHSSPYSLGEEDSRRVHQNDTAHKAVRPGPALRPLKSENVGEIQAHVVSRKARSS